MHKINPTPPQGKSLTLQGVETFFPTEELLFYLMFKFFLTNYDLKMPQKDTDMGLATKNIFALFYIRYLLRF